MSILKTHRLSVITLLGFIVLSGCSEKSEHFSPTISPTTPIENNITKFDPQVAARMGENVLYMDELDKDIALTLYDLQEPIYHLRRKHLQQLIDKGTFATGVEMLLQPPKRPRIELPRENRLVRGNPEAPVRLSVFCSYQSSYCVRLQPILLRILQQYHDVVNISYFDYPQHFHRYGRLLAEAVHCVAEQGNTWQYQDHLLARVEDIDRAKLLKIAGILQFNTTSLEACLTTHKYAAAIDADITLAKKIGIRNVPVSFINGLYLPGLPSFEDYGAIIDAELARLQLTTAKADANHRVISTLPIKLLASSVSNLPEKSKALLSIEERQAEFYTVESELMAGVSLKTIDYDKVTIDNKGRLEIIRLWDESGKTAPDNDKELSLYEQAEQQGASPSATSPSSTEEADGQMTLPAPTAILPISRTWLDNHLLNQVELEEQIKQAEHVVEGHNLLKLSDSNLDPFYQTLGLEPGDVLMMVNNQWVHSDQNSLWDALRENKRVTAVVMRRGYPVVYEYNIEDKP